MSLRLVKTLLLAAAVSALLPSCKKTYSSDNVLPPSYNPSIIVGSDNNILYALDPQTGTKNWEYSFSQSIFASPLVYNDMVYIGLTNLNSGLGQLDTLYKISTKTGKLIKKMVLTAGNHNFSIRSTPVADGNLIYVGTTNDTLFAIDTGTGAVKWAYDAGAGTGGGQIISSPTVHNGKVYCANTLGTIFCVDKTLGTLTWSLNPGPGKQFLSSAAIEDSLLFIGCSDSSMYCLYLTNFGGGTTMGTIKWIFPTAGSITSSPAAYFGNCVFGSNDFNVYCVDVITGLKKWKFTTGSNINFSSPTISGQVAYIGSNDYNMYALDMIDGHQKWKFTTNGLISSSPTAYNGRIYIGSYDNTIYAVDSAAGTLKWSNYVGGHIECSPAVSDYTTRQSNSQISGFTN